MRTLKEQLKQVVIEEKKKEVRGKGFKGALPVARKAMAPSFEEEFAAHCGVNNDVMRNAMLGG